MVPQALLSDFEHATRGHYRDSVVLTDQAGLLEYEPISLFNVWNAHYSNPASLFAERARFIQRLGSESDPAVVAAALQTNRYDRVD